ncbi:MAG: hypothetical protein ACI9ON_004441, partial [Limisphaerales bacterium]
VQFGSASLVCSFNPLNWNVNVTACLIIAITVSIISHVAEVFGEEARAKLKRIRGQKTSLRITRKDMPMQTVVCTINNDAIHLADRDGLRLNKLAKAQ